MSQSPELALRNILDSIGSDVEVPVIARTSHSTVYRARSTRYGRTLAVKVIDVQALPAPIVGKFLPRELMFTKLARHPHIARALSITTPIPSKVIIVSEYYGGGTLLDLILRQKNIPEYLHGARLFRQLTEAVHYLHERDVVHRDIKADNVLLDENGDVKLIDFGFARYIDQRERSKSYCGTKPYSAPEIVKHQPYSPYAGDWYAMGVLLFTMLTGKWPHNPYDKNDKLPRGVEFPTNKTPSKPARSLILSLMHGDESLRGNYRTIIESEWMKGFNRWLIADQNFIYEVIDDMNPRENTRNLNSAESM